MNVSILQCVFFCICHHRGSKTFSIFFNSILFDGKVNLVDALGRNLKLPIVFKSAVENDIQIKGKWEFLRKISF